MKSLSGYSMTLNNLVDSYANLDLNNADDVVNFIYKMNCNNEYIPEEIIKAMVINLKRNGVLDYKEYEKKHNYMDRYNNAEQYYFLNENKEEIAGNLLCRFMSSLDFYGKPNVYVKYLTLIYKNRFIDRNDKNKIEILKSMPTFKQYAKTHK